MYYSRGSLILEAFLSQLVPKPHFALTIKLDPDGIEWTHLIGVLDFTLTPDELPATLSGKLLLILQWIKDQGQHTFVLNHHTLDSAPENAQDTLVLTAWWLEWKRRRKNAHRTFDCTHCRKRIDVKTQGTKVDMTIYSCPDNACLTWELLSKVTGAPVLRVVENVESA